jgi:hypothetical protein
MFKPEITSHEAHGVPAQSISIPGHGTYDARTDTLELVTEHLAHLSVRELRSRMIRAFHAFEGKSAKHYLDGLRRAELLFIAAEYPSLYLPGMVQALGLKCDTEGRYWVPPTTEADEPASPFVADPENPTHDEIAAAIQRGLADGSIIDADTWLAQAAQDDAQDAPVLRFPGFPPVQGTGPVITAQDAPQDAPTAASHPLRAIGSRAYFAGLSVVVEAVDTSGPYPVATVRYVATNRTEKIAADAVRLA